MRLLFHERVAKAFEAGLTRLLSSGAMPSPADVARLERSGQGDWLWDAVLMAMDRHHREAIHTEALASASLSSAIACIVAIWPADEVPVDRSFPWLKALAVEQPDLVLTTLERMAAAAFEVGGTSRPAVVNAALHAEPLEPVRSAAALSMLDRHGDRLDLGAFASALRAALDEPRLTEIATARLDEAGTNASRLRWGAAAAAAGADRGWSAVAEALSTEPTLVDTLAKIVDQVDDAGGRVGLFLGKPAQAARAMRDLAPLTERQDWPARPDAASQMIERLLDGLAVDPEGAASGALSDLLDEPALAEWHWRIRRDLDARARQRQKPLSAARVAAALEGGPPAGHDDLKALVLDALEALQRDLRDGPTGGWRAYWMPKDRKGRDVREPLSENDCRDRLVERLGDRLRHLGIETERRSEGDRRVDIAFEHRSSTGRTLVLPVECKLHSNRELWTGPSDQLLDYARRPEADGHGLYLVFWHGSDRLATKGMPEGPKPASPAELRERLRAVLPSKPGDKLDVFVLDVSPTTRA